MEPELMCDALDDLHDFFDGEVKPAPSVPVGGYNPMMRLMVAQFQRNRGIGDPTSPAVGRFGLEIGFLLACNELAPDLFGDLVKWRLGSTAHDYTTGRTQVVAEDQDAARKNRRHREYRDGLREKGLR